MTVGAGAASAAGSGGGGPTCPEGSQYNKETRKCEADPVPTCPEGASVVNNPFSHYHGQCEVTPICPEGTYRGVDNVCYDEATLEASDPSCPSGYTLGFELDPAPLHRCVQQPTPGCLDGYTYNSTTGKCQTRPIGGSGGGGGTKGKPTR